MLMENFMRSKQYWSAIEDEIPVIREETKPTKAQRTTLEEAKLKDIKAKNYLFQAIDRSISKTMLTKDTAKDIWDSLKTKYQGTACVQRVQCQALQKEYEMLSMHDESKDLDVITIDELQKRRLEEEVVVEVKREDEVEAEAGVFLTNPLLNVTAVTSLGISSVNVQTKTGSRSNYMENNEEMLLMACVEEEKSEVKQIFGFSTLGVVIICVVNGIFFCDLDKNFKETVMLGDDRGINVMGKDSVRLLVNGFIQVITSVFYVPGLRNNLLSGGQLMEKGLEILKRNGSCKIYHPEKGLILEAPMAKNKMFKFFTVAQGKKEMFGSVLINLDWGESETLADATILARNSNGSRIDATSEDIELGSTNVKEGEINTSSEDHSSRSSEDIPLVNDTQRRRQPPTWMQEYESGEEMDAEIEAIEKNDTWEMTDLPYGAKKVGVKWVYKTKYNENGEVEKYKTRLVAKGYAQKCGIDYTEVFSPIARLETIRLVISLAAQNDWVLFQLDDFIFIGNDKQMYVEFKTSMMNEFDMTDLGKVRYFLGIKVRQSEACVFICQKRYAQGVLERFNMDKCNSVQNLIVPGCQLTRDEKGVHGASNRDALSSSKVSIEKQPIVTLSTTEAEFVAAASCACQAVWL
uniref:Uncharacterized protein n=1 Tax=Tanacetum cinerariifolium TaxID=118510 RepID=A0A6L2LLF6_TANCI|nr:hypothetical protein [Tanacetum cinerariifolium]